MTAWSPHAYLHPDEPVPAEAAPRLRAAAPADLPPALAASRDRHRHHLAALAAAMRAAGFDDDAVARGVRTLVASYEAGLLGAVRALTETHDAA